MPLMKKFLKFGAQIQRETNQKCIDQLPFPIDHIVTYILTKVHGICKFQQHVLLKQEQVALSSRQCSPWKPFTETKPSLRGSGY